MGVDTAREQEEEGRDRARALRLGLLGLAFVGVVVVALVLALPGLDSVQHLLGHAGPGWIVLAAALELLSCYGYVLTIQLVFSRLSRPGAARLAWSELAANQLLPAGGVGGLGLGAWVLRSRGVPAARLAERSIVVFLLTSLPSIGALSLIGFGLYAGVLDGPRDAMRGLLPGIAGAAGIVICLVLPRLVDRIRRPPRVAAAARAVAEGVRSSVDALRHPQWRIAGPFAYFVFDVAVLWACFRAVGADAPVAVIAMGYLIGQLGGLLPLPGGLGGIDGGLIGMLVVYGVHFAPASAAVLLYRALSLWLPSLIGTAAFVRLWRRLRQLPPPRPRTEAE